MSVAVRGLARRFPSRWTGALCAAAALLLAAPDARAAQGGGDEAPVRHVLAGSTGAKLRNLPDKKGPVVLEAPADTPLAVYAESAGYLKVEAPGGVRVWVYGKYLKPTERAGWYELTGNYVSMRPLPRSSQDSFPVGRVYVGDRVRSIQRLDATRPLAEDWVQVWSPPGTTAWVLAAETRALPATANPSELWSTAVDAAAARREAAAPAEVATTPASGPAQPTSGAAAAAPKAQDGEPVPATALGALDVAERQLAAAVESGKYDYDALTAAFAAVLERKPDAPTRKLVERRLDELRLRREHADLQADLEAERLRREQEKADLERQLAEASLRRDHLWGRFQARGWLERIKLPDGKPAYRISWGGEIVTEVVSSSGRYDLDAFTDFEIGITGRTLRAASADGKSLPRLDARQIEVISGRLGAGAKKR